jgi:hypothetical protein
MLTASWLRAWLRHTVKQWMNVVESTFAAGCSWAPLTCRTKPMLRFMFLLGGAPLNVMSPSLRIMLQTHATGMLQSLRHTDDVCGRDHARNRQQSAAC